MHKENFKEVVPGSEDCKVIGSSFGSPMGQVFTMSPKQRIVLVAAGAGAGIAATFNTPIGGVLFPIELILHEVSIKTLVPVVIATAIATCIGQLFFGVHPSFVIPVLQKPYFHLASPWLLVSYAVLGVLWASFPQVSLEFFIAWSMRNYSRTERQDRFSMIKCRR